MVRAFSLIGAVLAGILLGAGLWLTLVPAPDLVLSLSGHEYQIANGPQKQASVDDAIALRAQQLNGASVYIKAEGDVFELPARELGLTIDQDLARAQVTAGLSQLDQFENSNFGLYLWRRFSDEPGHYSIELKTNFEEDVAIGKLKRLALLVDEEPVSAQMLIAEHKITASRMGLRLSPGASAVRLAHAELGTTIFVEVVVERTRPRITEKDLAPVDITKVLATYETTYRGHAGARAVNIRNAGRLLNGAIILPGEVLSFNQHVGRRIHGRGFVDAPVIVNDELEMDVGGGVCQVATTLHAAAVYGNLEVTRRRSHSRPSSYAPLGLDATVVDGKVDLRLRNPFDEPVLVYVSFPNRYKIRVELLGRDPDVVVEHAYTVTHREPFGRRIWRKEEMPLGGFEKKQKGSPGMDVVSVLRIKGNDGKIERRSYRSKYYPVPEVFWVSQGAKATEDLPDLPEGATGVVVDGQEISSAADEESPRQEEEVPSLSEADSSATTR